MANGGVWRKFLSAAVGRDGSARLATAAGGRLCRMAVVVLLPAIVLVTGCSGWAPMPAALENHTAHGQPESLADRPTLETDMLPGQPLLAFSSSRAGNGDIFLLGANATPINLTRSDNGDWDPEWSPTCARGHGDCRIVFTSHRSGDSEIWTMDANGRNLQNVSQHPAWDYWPTWSPDGRQIAFVSERDGDQELFIQTIGTRSATQLTFNTESDRLPSWSPDGGQIVFSAVRGGIEEIHLITVDGLNEWSLSRWPAKGTAPVWSPDGERIGFVGASTTKHPGIYLMDLATNKSRKLWEGTDWLGSLAWGRCDGNDILYFSGWLEGNHNIYALPLDHSRPITITRSAAWDDFPSLSPACVPPGEVLWPKELAAGTERPERISAAGVHHGANIADLSDAYLLKDMGFGWAKGFVNWETVEVEQGEYKWADPDRTVNAFRGRGREILLRIHGTPAWARPRDTFLTYPPDDVEWFGDFAGKLAARYKGRVDAYEIWNEQNLSYEWGYLSPDARAYTRMLQAAYRAIKTADPEALVISGGLATTGNGSPTAAGDLAYLQGMYDAGARGAFDALGSHPYAFGNSPDKVDPWGLSLSRVADQRQVMVANGDEVTPIWITELGWVLDTSWDLVEHESIGVSEAEQAEYLGRAYEKVASDWPYVQAIFVFNLDFGGVPWYTASEPMRWYAVLNPDRSPRPAYVTLAGR